MNCAKLYLATNRMFQLSTDEWWYSFQDRIVLPSSTATRSLNCGIGNFVDADHFNRIIHTHIDRFNCSKQPIKWFLLIYLTLKKNRKTRDNKSYHKLKIIYNTQHVGRWNEQLVDVVQRIDPRLFVSNVCGGSKRRKVIITHLNKHWILVLLGRWILCMSCMV